MTVKKPTSGADASKPTPQASPCPNCGHCPHCGHTPPRPAVHMYWQRPYTTAVPYTGPGAWNSGSTC